MIAEVVEFKVKGSVEEFLRAADEMAPSLRNQRGYLGRRLLNAGELWIDLVFWETGKDAGRAAKNALGIEDFQRFFSFLDESTTSLEHYKVVGSWE